MMGRRLVPVMAPAPTPPSLFAVAERVEARLTSLVCAERERWAALDADLAVPFESLASMVLGGGKRLRPAFCYWGFVGVGGDPDSAVVIDAGAAFELLHAFALFHDDVMDGSSTRRGARTAHLVYADHHDAGAWNGEARRFGEGVAILIGDLAFVYADLLLADAPPPALELWHELRIELNVGQYLDLLGTARADRNVAGAQRIARYKSGKYTVERPLHLGAALAAPERMSTWREPLSAFGLPLGDAFQLRDDVLGAFGDHATTGKPVGDDLREGKPTVLLAIATERATAAQRAVLQSVGHLDLGAADVAAIQAVLVDTGALAEIETRIEALVSGALDALERAPLSEHARRCLEELANYVAWREL